MTIALTILFGTLVGFALGLTGGGGSLLAVPLLVYGLSIAPHDAFGISLAAVAAMATLGVISRFRRGHVEIKTGLIFASAGMIGAPLGTWMSSMLTETVLLTSFSILMLFIARRLWQKASVDDQPASTSTILSETRSCQRNPQGRLPITSRCGLVLALVGLLTGFLSGMYGVGGGFVIVPALILFTQMPIHRAVGTSFLVIVLVGLSGVLSLLAGGRGIPLDIAGLFVLGGILGLHLGTRSASKLSGPRLQRVFATGIVAVATFVVLKTIY